MIITSANRVALNTDPKINERIRLQTLRNISFFQSHPGQIDQRIRELEEEWDIERMLETGSSALTLTGIVFSIVRKRRWILLSLAVQGFFLRHAIQGWCPPLPVLRRLGFRTQSEISEERHALKALRGDYDVSDEKTVTNKSASQSSNKSAEAHDRH